MWANTGDLFSQICSKVSNKLYFEQLMMKQQQFFDIQPYKIDKLYSQPAKKLYKQISFKYQVTKQLVPNPNLWHQNQRKIFIWFIVCYFHQMGAQDPLEIAIDWEKLSEIFFSKSCSFLKFQFLNIIKLKKRILWTIEQDTILAKATEQQGIGKWNEISKALFFNSDGLVFKSPKHCRQRWLNHLDANKNKGKWTDQQDYKILLYVKEYGKKWSKIVQVLHNTRTEHMIKNRFNSLLTKNRKNKKQKEMQTVNKIIKCLERTTLVSDSQDSSQKPDKKMTQYLMDQLQSDQQCKQIQLSGENNFLLKCDSKISEKQEIQPKRTLRYKSSFELSSMDTMPLLNSFSALMENFGLKNDEQRITNNSFQHVFWNKCSAKVDRSKTSTLEQGKAQVAMDLSVSQKLIYKTKPVYILQLNV